MSAIRSVFVTGATGVVGRHLVPGAVALGHRVTAVGRSDDKRAWLTARGARAVGLDLFDVDAVRRALEDAEADTVINLATHIPSSPLATMFRRSWRENDRLRKVGSMGLATAAREAGVRRLVQESFAPIYEDGGDRWLDETWPQRPLPFNRTVLDAERSATEFAEQGGESVVLRFAAFYGPDPLLATMLATVRRGWSPLPGAADAFWSSLAQEDAAAAALAALELPSGIYNVGDDEPLTRAEMMAAFGEALGTPAPRSLPRWLGRFGGDVFELLARSLRIDNAKLRRASDWRPRWKSLRDGLPAAVRALGAAEAPS